MDNQLYSYINLQSGGKKRKYHKINIILMRIFYYFFTLFVMFFNK
ncbi:hypothetical protein J2783_003380 [Chryseobacterium sediminis]|nr:hypothetical protein [Chryseobacterium sediminis]